VRAGEARGNTDKVHGNDPLAAAVAAPATVSGEPVVRVSHWETGKAGWQALTREPGDLPALSPNRWAEGPHGAAVRSGDATTDAKAAMVSNAVTRNLRFRFARLAVAG